MKVIPPSFEIINLPSQTDAYAIIGQAIDNCYRADLNSKGLLNAEKIKRVVRLNHLSTIEHVSATINIICDRGVSHELVRHRLCSFSQESTRYCNYSNAKFGNEVTFITPSFVTSPLVSARTQEKYILWLEAMKAAEENYFEMLSLGASPQEARAVLPNSLATKIAITANLREWRHIFNLRCDEAAHPDMRQTMLPILALFSSHYPEIFSSPKEAKCQK